MTLFNEPGEENNNTGATPDQPETNTPAPQPPEQAPEQPTEQPPEQPAEQPTEQPTEQPVPSVPSYTVATPPAAPQNNGTKKLSGGSKAFLAVLAVTVCAVLIFTAVYIAKSLGGSSATPNTVSGIVNSQDTVSSPGVTLDDLITKQGGDYLSTTEAYNKVLPSVVGIKTYVLSSLSVYGEGSGIILSADGYILTCYHLVEDVSTVEVTTSDGKVYEAVLVVRDANTDIAVLKIEATGLTAAEFGSSGGTAVGEFVMAIGNPTGSTLANSASFGILSGKQRVDSADAYTSLLQVDAAVNPGNSGGPLINLKGQVIGMVSSKIASVDYEGIGFAIPSDEMLPIVEDLLANGYATGRVRIGLTVSEYAGGVVTAQNLPGCVVVVDVVSGCSADKQGIQPNDIITAVDGVAVTSSEQLIQIIRSHKAGDTLAVSIYRKSAGVTETLTLNVTLYEDKG